jgi:hypothetical protein
VLFRLAAFLDLGVQPVIDFRLDPADSLRADVDWARKSRVELVGAFGVAMDSSVDGGSGKPRSGFDLLTPKDVQRVFELSSHAVPHKYSPENTGMARYFLHFPVKE